MGEALDYADLKSSFFDLWEAQATEVTVVFAQGKTGTSSIAAGLKRAGFDPVFQVHTLLPRALARVEADYLQRTARGHPRHVWEGQWLRRHPPTVGRPWKVVTSVRDPIARIVSRHFQQTSRFHGFEHPTSVEAVVADLTAVCNNELRRLGTVGSDWFELELRPVLGQSVYDTPFEPAKGFASITSSEVSVLLLRNESLSKAPEALSQHFGRPVELTSENMGSAKDYGDLYGLALHHFRPPAAYVERVYDTRQARHFYSAEELDGFRARWTRPVGSLPPESG